MMSFRGDRLKNLRLPLSIVWLLETLAESKGRQQLYEMQSPQILNSLKEMALIESAESSNRIEGVTVERNRLRPLVIGSTRPFDRSEEEIVGYRMALNWIHTDSPKIRITPETCLHLHALAQGGTSGDAGNWKTTQNDIIEIFPDGRREVRFRPVAPDLVPKAMEELCLSYRHAIDQQKVTPLLASTCFVLDFLCIHPFRDGNGRISRLLTLLLCYHHGYNVGRFVSLERIIEQSKADYYEALGTSSAGWHDGEHDVLPWFTFLLSTWRRAYREFENRAERNRPKHGSKTDLVEYALQSMVSPFGIADVEQLCPSVSRDTIRLVMNRWRERGNLVMLGKGRDAKWKRIMEK